jgi:cathepsin B
VHRRAASLTASRSACVRAINKQGLPWKAMLRAELEGRTVGSFGMGYKPLPEEVRRQYVTTLDTTGFTPPVYYDARDRYASAPSCVAYNVLSQGKCGSCYAFAAATSYSARLCRFNPGSVGNVVVSPQELMDCTNGCDGGSPIAVFQALFTNPAVEAWCDPYTEAKSTCGGVCATGNSYSAQAGSIKVIGSAGAGGVLQIQLELMRNGPCVVTFEVYDDFQAYSSGVYIKSASAKYVGAHAVTLVGFGVDGPWAYWLIQNSWGPNWGMSGFAKIRRGFNECDIESRGFEVVKPIAPTVCSASPCKNGATTLKDCSCRCAGGWSGSECAVCSLT